MRRRAIAGLLLLGAGLAGVQPSLHAQGLSVDVSAGRLVYDPVSTSVGTNNLVGSLRYDTRRGPWVYGALAAPLADEDTFWGAAGAGGRLGLQANRRLAFGADVGAHGFSYRDTVLDQRGTGATIDAVPFARITSGLAFVEGRGGWRGHTLSVAGTRESRGVFETGARVGYGALWHAEGDVRWAHAAEGAFPFLGTTVAYDGAPVQVWGQTGKWLHANLDQVTWGGGLAVPFRWGSTVWASVRQEATDPLFWNSPRRSWSVGMTQRLGRVMPPLRPAQPARAGTVQITLPAGDAPSGQVFIAGDFNNWQPAAMRREGSDWIIQLPLAPGVYNYAFRSAMGEWFVPASTPGRRDDGMGGHVAVLMVT